MGGIVAAALATAIGVNGASASSGDDGWWSPDDGRVMPEYVDYPNEYGKLRVLNADGAFSTRDHAFFTALGTNGRACVTCHQPSDGMSLSAKTAQRRWELTNGKDPLFAAIDGSNCPSLPQEEKASHSLLLERGLFRIPMRWPPRDASGKAIEPEFSIEVVSDPTGCNLDPVYGLNSDNPTVSVFRRPRPAANLRYVMQIPQGVFPYDMVFFNDRTLLPRDPETGEFVPMQLMSDGRVNTLKEQAVDAGVHHLQVMGKKLTKKQLDQIESFERQVYAAQVYHKLGGDLTSPDAPPGLSPNALRDGAAGRLGNNPINKVFGSFQSWANQPEKPNETPEEKEIREFRASAARGADIFWKRRFMIRDVGMYNDKGLGNPIKRSCGSGCHNTLLMGMDLAPGYMDLGLNNFPWQNVRTDLPLFKITCKDNAKPQSYLGRVIYSHDPGRALVTGRCGDVGASITQQMRGLAARAPFFMNGSSMDLREMVDFYDRRFNIGYTESEKVDLVNFMSTL